MSSFDPLDPTPPVPATSPGDRLTRSLGDSLRTALTVIGGIVAVLWIVEAIDTVDKHRLDAWGVRPHTLVGLRGIAFAPFLHSGFTHLIGNTVPFALFGLVVLTGGIRRFVAVTVIVAVTSGAGTWLLGQSDQVHIGASGVVFGYLGYLVSRGFFERKIGQIAAGVLVALVYGGMIWGILPNQRGVSWQGHLFGLLGGVLAARLLAPPTREPAA